MQESFWWWQCSDRYIISLFPNLHTPFSPSLNSLMVSWTLSTTFTLTYLLTDKSVLLNRYYSLFQNWVVPGLCSGVVTHILMAAYTEGCMISGGRLVDKGCMAVIQKETLAMAGSRVPNLSVAWTTRPPGTTWQLNIDWKYKLSVSFCRVMRCHVCWCNLMCVTYRLCAPRCLTSVVCSNTLRGQFVFVARCLRNELHPDFHSKRNKQDALTLNVPAWADFKKNTTTV